MPVYRRNPDATPCIRPGRYESNTYDPIMDLSLEINKCADLQRALEHFSKKEVLDGDNMYRQEPQSPFDCDDQECRRSCRDRRC